MATIGLLIPPVVTIGFGCWLVSAGSFRISAGLRLAVLSTARQVQPTSKSQAFRYAYGTFKQCRATFWALSRLSKDLVSGECEFRQVDR
jgi:hypothetical protein